MRILLWIRDIVSILPVPDSFSEPVHWPTMEQVSEMSSEQIVDWVQSTHFRQSDKKRAIEALEKVRSLSFVHVEETLPMK